VISLAIKGYRHLNAAERAASGAGSVVWAIDADGCAYRALVTGDLDTLDWRRVAPSKAPAGLREMETLDVVTIP
jgi:hypothetical protein